MNWGNTAKRNGFKPPPMVIMDGAGHLRHCNSIEEMARVPLTLGTMAVEANPEWGEQEAPEDSE